jgi:hypothetical protein
MVHFTINAWADFFVKFRRCASCMRSAVGFFAKYLAFAAVVAVFSTIAGSAVAACPSNLPQPCGDGCYPNGWVCCDDSNKLYACQKGNVCCGGKCQEKGGVCCGGSLPCPEGHVCCHDSDKPHCCEEGGVCCAEAKNGYCGKGEVCCGSVCCPEGRVCIIRDNYTVCCPKGLVDCELHASRQ